jgi:hypothetical protein
MINQEKKVRNKIHKGLTDLHKASFRIAKEWGLKSIPLTTFKEVIKKGKVDTEGISNAKLLILYKSYNKTLDVMFDTCQKKAAEMKSDHVSVAYIKVCVNHVKKNMGI